MRRGAAGGTVLLLAALPFSVLPARGGAQDWRTVSLSRQLSGAPSLDASVKYGAGRFRLRPTGDGSLYRMNLRYDDEVTRPVADYREGRLTLGVESVGRRLSLGRGRGEAEMDVELATGVTMELDLELGAVRADIDLGGLALTDLQIRTGASETRLDVSAPNPTTLRRAKLEVGAAELTARRLGNLNAREMDVSAGVGEVTLDLSGDWRGDATVRVQMGLGSLHLVFPRGLGVRLLKESFLTSLDAQGLVKRGEAYYSPDWESATHKVTVDVEAAFGSIHVRWTG